MVYKGRFAGLISLYMVCFIYLPTVASIYIYPYPAQKAEVEAIGRFRVLPIFLHPGLFKDDGFWKVLL